MLVGLSLLLARLLAMLAFGAFSDICQVLQSDETVGVLIHDAMTDHVVDSLFQSSLSSANHDQASCGRTSAFLLQPFSQSGIMVSFGPDLFARIECRLIPGGSGDGKIALLNINTNHGFVSLRGWLCSLYLNGNQQLEFLVGLVIPHPGCSHMSIMLVDSNVLLVTPIGLDTPPLHTQ